MLRSVVLALGALPMLLFLSLKVLPSRFLEPYAWWSAAGLNGAKGTQWRNLGWWENTDDFSTASEALAKKLLDFANAPNGGVVLDIGHGSGESLGLHLSQDPPPKQLHALTSLPSETRQAQDLVSRRFPNLSTEMVWYTSSAEYQAKIIHHPLNPMRGYLGKSSTVYDEEGDDDDLGRLSQEQVGPQRYDLVYILDAIYHFPPSVPEFLSSVLPTMSPGGVIAFTDILPPPDANAIPGSWILPTLLSVPSRNLFQRPKGLDEYKRLMEQLGFIDVEIQDWSAGVWPGFARNLFQRGGLWKWVGRIAVMGYRSGWKYIAVRAVRPLDPEM